MQTSSPSAHEIPGAPAPRQMPAGQSVAGGGRGFVRPPPAYVGALNAAIDLVSARMLGLLAVVGAIAMFGYAVYRPEEWRTYTVGLYAIVVLWPLVYLYLKKEV